MTNLSHLKQKIALGMFFYELNGTFTLLRQIIGKSLDIHFRVLFVAHYLFHQTLWLKLKALIFFNSFYLISSEGKSW